MDDSIWRAVDLAQHGGEFRDQFATLLGLQIERLGAEQSDDPVQSGKIDGSSGVDQGARQADRGHDAACQRAGPADPCAVRQQGDVFERVGAGFHVGEESTLLLPKGFRGA